MTPGVHHVTAMAGDPQANVDFYAGVLGLRLAKVTVNMDDPGTYHLYYGDEVGSPGTAMTFFPWPTAPPARLGRGQVGATAFSVPVGSLAFWEGRLRAAGADPRASERFGQGVLSLKDPDGLCLDLVEAEDSRVPWQGDGVPADVAVRGFHSVSLLSSDSPSSERLLTGVMGFRKVDEADGRVRLMAGEGAPHQIVDLVDASGQAHGTTGPGTHHHVAFRVADDAGQLAVVEALKGVGVSPTAVTERYYFRSVYFREPGKVLFEIATDGPGFTVDEPAETLGGRLCLPPWLEPHRNLIRASLPSVRSPRGVVLP